MSIGQVLLWSAGVLLAMVLVCGVSVWMDRKFPGESFDERQAMFRGKAAALTLFWGNIYFLYILICLDGDFPMPFGTGTMIFLGILGQAVLFHIYCVMKHAALPLGQNGWLAALSYGAMGILQMLRYNMERNLLERYASRLAEQGKAVPEDHLDSAWVILFLAITFCVVALLHLISMLWKVREDHE